MHTYAYRNCFGVGLNLGRSAQIPYVWVTHLAYTDWVKIYFSEFQIFVKTKVGHRAKTRKNPKLFWGRTKFGRSSPNTVFWLPKIAYISCVKIFFSEFQIFFKTKVWVSGENSKVPKIVLGYIHPKFCIYSSK